MGEPAVMHHRMVSGCREAVEVPPECWEVGLGNPGYDCSGFIIAITSRVLGISLSDWPRNERHVRDWWSAESTIFDQHSLSEEMVREVQQGDILVSRRVYETGEGTIIMPGHVSIVTKKATTDSLPHILSANTLLQISIQEVIERPMVQLAPIMGSLTLKEDNFPGSIPDHADAQPDLRAVHGLRKSVS